MIIFPISSTPHNSIYRPKESFYEPIFVTEFQQRSKKNWVNCIQQKEKKKGGGDPKQNVADFFFLSKLPAGTEKFSS
jgi:hypothetical protein